MPKVAVMETLLVGGEEVASLGHLCVEHGVYQRVYPLGVGVGPSTGVLSRQTLLLKVLSV